MEESIKMDKIKLITMSPLVLAYLGDTVYESYIREHLIRQNMNRKVNNLHKLAIQYSKRGRNQKSHTAPKNADIIDYKYATGFEALIGYLYLGEEKERLEYIIQKGIEIIERDM